MHYDNLIKYTDVYFFVWLYEDVNEEDDVENN